MPKLSAKALVNLFWYALFLGVLFLIVSWGLYMTRMHVPGKTDRMLGDGRLLMRLMYAAAADEDSSVELPNGQYSNATQYLELLLAHDVVDTLDGFIDAQGRSRWCVVENIESVNGDVPWLFSTNVPIERLDESLQPEEIAPLYRKAEVVVIYGSHSQRMSARAFATEVLSRGAKNRVLRP